MSLIQWLKQQAKAHRAITILAIVAVLALVGGIVFAATRGGSTADASGDSATTPTTQPPTEEDLKSAFDTACNDLTHSSSFIRNYPGTAYEDGQVKVTALPVVAGDDQATKIQAAMAILDQVQPSLEGQFYWSYLNFESIFDSPMPQRTVDLTTEADKWREDPAERKMDCEKIVTQLRGGQNEQFEIREWSREDGPFSLLMFTDNYQSAQVYCMLEAPAEGLHVWQWNAANQEVAEGQALKTVAVALEYNAIWFKDCAGDNPVIETIEVPTSIPEEAPDEEADAVDDEQPEAGEETSTPDDTVDAADDPADGGDDANDGENTGDGTGDDGGDGGHDDSQCDDKPDCGDGGGGDDCKDDCPGDDGGCKECPKPTPTPAPTTTMPRPTTTTTPPTTATTTVPPTTTTTTVPPTTTTPPTTRPPTTTTPPTTVPPTTTTPPTTRPPTTTTPPTTVPCPPGYTRLPDGSCKAPDPGLPGF